MASAPEIFIAVSSITTMGSGSVDIAEKKVKQAGAPVYLYNFGYKSEIGKNGKSTVLDMQLMWPYQLAANLEKRLGINELANQYVRKSNQLKQTIQRKY